MWPPIRGAPSTSTLASLPGILGYLDVIVPDNPRQSMPQRAKAGDLSGIRLRHHLMRYDGVDGHDLSGFAEGPRWTPHRLRARPAAPDGLQDRLGRVSRPTSGAWRNRLTGGSETTLWHVGTGS